MPQGFAKTLLVAAVAVSALALSPPTSAATATAYDTLEAPLVSRINKLRASRGLAKLRVVPALTKAATRHANSMGSASYFSHSLRTASGMKGFSTWIRWYWPGRGYSSWSAGENLFCSNYAPTAREVVRAWMNSPSHRTILLTARWRNIGVSAVRSSPWSGLGACLGNATIVAAEFGRRS